MAPATRLTCPNGHNTGDVRLVNVEFFLRTPLGFDEAFPRLSKLTPQALVARLQSSTDKGWLELECGICAEHWLVDVDGPGRLQDNPYFPQRPRSR